MQLGSPAKVRLLAMLALMGTLALAGSALGDDTKESVLNGDKLDVSKIADDFVIAHDGNGHYVAATPGVNSWELHYGDGKTFHKQIVNGAGSDGSKDQNSWSYFEPREEGYGDLVRQGTTWTFTCGKRKATFNTISDKERTKMVKAATFKPFKFNRQPHALLRDTSGTYYFVDKQRADGKGFRLFVGRRGNMKMFSLVDIVDDSEGQIFITKKGDLHLVIDDDEKITWTKEEQTPKKLKRLPLAENRILVYTDLGPYETERMGTPCDEI